MIFYFSSTGNSRWAAETVAGLTGDIMVDITDALYNINKVYALNDGEALGFVFPVHGWRVPLIVREFIAKVLLQNATPDTYVFSLFTAGDSVGETAALTRDLLTARGLHLDASFSIIMPESYIGLPFMYLDKPARECRKRLQAEALLHDYATDINARKHVEHLHKGLLPHLYSGLLGSFFYNVCVTDKHFHVDAERCIGCGICERSCPVGDIRIEADHLPQWQGSDRCMTCYSCLHHCPENAISWGWFTSGKGQYTFRNP